MSIAVRLSHGGVDYAAHGIGSIRQLWDLKARHYIKGLHPPCCRLQGDSRKQFAINIGCHPDRFLRNRHCLVVKLFHTAQGNRIYLHETS